MTISGQRAGAAAGTTVELWQELPGQSRFHRVAQTTTNPSGHYTFVRVAQTNASWHTTASGAKSRTVVQSVSAVIHLTASSARPAAGRADTFSGRVSPSHRGERIVLQERTAHGWRTLGSATLGSRSRFALRHRFAHKGKLVLRALLGADRRNTQSASAPMRIVVH